MDKFDVALKHFEEAAEQSRIKYANNQELHDVVTYIYEDVYRCLCELKSAIVLSKSDSEDEKQVADDFGAQC